MSARVLVVTNDFPPRTGGIQSFVHGIVERLPADSVVVLTSNWRGSDQWDATQPYPIIRTRSSVMLPGLRARRLARRLVREYHCDTVVFGAAVPLGLMAPTLRTAGVTRCVGITHGHEAGWTRWPILRQIVAVVGRRLDAMTYLGEYTRSHIAPVIGAKATAMVRLAPGINTKEFAPSAHGLQRRSQWDLEDRPVVVCVSRVMPRKGQDMLVRAWPQVQQFVPNAALLLVGGGPHRKKVRKLIDQLGLSGDVVMTGTVERDQLPSYYSAGDVFAMPCRTRNAGLDVEGLGIVYLEASACGLPVIAGRSGGAPDAIREGVTGVSVDGRSPTDIASAIVRLLQDPQLSAQMGQAGRAWVESQWTWQSQIAVVDQLIAASH